MKAEYIDHMGDDIRVVNAARVSMAKESEWEWAHTFLADEDTVFPGIDLPHLSEKDQKLITYLAKNSHWTPFAHCQVTLRETMPIFMARQRFKHKVGMVENEISRRYVDEEPTFYVPKVWRKRAESVKQGSSDEPCHGNPWMHYEYEDLLQKASELYNAILADGGCPEQARMVLPQSMFTSFYATGSLVAWARVYNQRKDPHAQREWGEILGDYDKIIRPLFPHAWAALVD